MPGLSSLPGGAVFQRLVQDSVFAAWLCWPGEWYRGLRLVAFDDLKLAFPDEAVTDGFPKLRLTVLMETGPRAPLAWCGGPLRELEMEQAERLVSHLSPGMLVLADRYDCGLSCGRGQLRPGRRFSGGSSRTRGFLSSRASGTGHG